mmetsp:Transcript_62374/g.182229  ORF Transcript_62374/g.182229 Transcript_62374/m.182229 type:complete len:197 (-) Transcript_62374:111-701(-)
MLLPLPSPPMQIGPPTEYARSRSPWMLALLIIQSVLCVLRIAFILDIMGGFIMLIMVGIGWYAWKEHLHITFVCSWGLLCLVNGSFDAVRLIDAAVKSQLPLFSSKFNFWYNLSSAVQIMIPVFTLAGALLAWFLYRDYSDHALPVQDFGDNRPYSTYGASGQQDARPLGRTMGDPYGDRKLAEPFAGQGHRLGTS